MNLSKIIFTTLIATFFFNTAPLMAGEDPEEVENRSKKRRRRVMEDQPLEIEYSPIPASRVTAAAPWGTDFPPERADQDRNQRGTIIFIILEPIQKAAAAPLGVDFPPAQADQQTNQEGFAFALESEFSIIQAAIQRAARHPLVRQSGTTDIREGRW